MMGMRATLLRAHCRVGSERPVLIGIREVFAMLLASRQSLPDLPERGGVASMRA